MSCTTSTLNPCLRAKSRIFTSFPLAETFFFVAMSVTSYWIIAASTLNVTVGVSDPPIVQ